MNIVRMRAKSLEDKKYRLLQDRLQAGLTEEERDFLCAAEIGDIDTLKNLLSDGHVSVNCSDPQGRTALELAVLANDQEVVCFLLERVSEKNVHKGLLCACDNDGDAICEIILQHHIYAKPATDGEEPVSQYSKYVTRKPLVELQVKFKEALIMAAKRNNFQIVKQLMLRGASLELPHDYFCNCHLCTTQRSEDFKVYTSTRLDTFRAMASPAYMVLTEEDPIISAFRHSVNFRKMAEIESEFKALYNELDVQVQNFTTDLLDQCYSSDEVKTILSGSSVLHGDGEDGEEEDDDDIQSNILPVLTLAIKMEQKKFVAHHQSQAQIAELWYSGVPFLRYLNRFAYLMLAIPIGIVLVPIMSIIYLIAPWSRVTQILSTPLMRFLSYTCSYLSFLIIVMVTKLKVSYGLGMFMCDDYSPISFAVITVLMMWIVGLIWEESKQIWAEGAKDYFSSLWNVIDFLMLSFLLAAFSLEIIIPIRMHDMLVEARQTDVTNASLLAAISLCKSLRDDNVPLGEFCHRSGHIHPVQVVWEPSWVPDPELMSDVLFTFGTILSIGRFSFIMPANEALGTMLVSFKRCLNDLLKLCGMFILVIISFSSGLSALYATDKCRNKHFKSFAATVSTLTWSLFGMGDVNAPVLRGNGPLDSLTNSPHRETGVETIGYYLYAIYLFAAMIILLNLLIAVMSNSFQEVQDESDIEWKFARTGLWLTFIEPGALVPPPFNIIPSPKSVLEFSRWCYGKCACTKKIEEEPKTYKYAYVQTSDFDLSKDDRSETKSQTTINSRRIRQDLYCTLIRRYVRDVEKHKIEEDDDASDEILRKLIEKVAKRTDDKILDLFKQIKTVDTTVNTVQDGEVDIKKLQVEHMEMVKAENERREYSTERFLHHLDQAKLELLARMEAERMEVLRIWEEQLRDVIKKMDESRRQHDIRLTSLEEKKASEGQPRWK